MDFFYFSKCALTLNNQIPLDGLYSVNPLSVPYKCVCLLCDYFLCLNSPKHNVGSEVMLILKMFSTYNVRMSPQ